LTIYSCDWGMLLYERGIIPDMRGDISRMHLYPDRDFLQLNMVHS